MNWRHILIVSDLDGTLVPENGRIPARNSEALQRFVDKGGRFTLATGRSIGSAGQFLPALPVNAPAICMNGGLLYDFAAKRILACEPLPQREAAVFLKSMYGHFPRLGAECFYQEEVGIVRRGPYIGNSRTPEIFPFADGVEQTPSGMWMKLFFGGETGEIQEALAYAQTLPHPGMRLVLSSRHFLEVLPERVSKGAMLRRLAEQLSLPLSQVYAVGDYDNDAELLAAAGHAVVPVNATERLKRQAELIVCHCSQGAVGELVEYLEEKER